ncbi:glycosyltransferase [Cognatilysobacter bugurensis]|uniref:Glycosyltransferase n=1 Tax=Cognatilysobacter bugurensis TaxID=543356 RepID=A0A918T244_9GAMM|nr:glycosyltransferase [Lysobacter bugurensis]GHA85711.1 hypothetical protein GCM10007067_24700 [Lysobacter bugurensis]
MKVPLPVWRREPSAAGRRDFGLPDDAFVFLTTFDFHSFTARKNPLAAIAAFKLAFPALTERVVLVVKSSNGERYPHLLAKLVSVSRGDPRIIIRDGVLERPHLRALQMAADVFVSLHRAEGFGLGLAECMALGKPVIATGWSGNLEFMSENNSCLVNWREIEVRPGEYVDTAESHRWAEPDVGHAASYMRTLAADPALGTAIGRRGQIDIERSLAPKVIGQALLHEFQALQSAHSGGGRV